MYWERIYKIVSLGTPAFISFLFLDPSSGELLSLTRIEGINSRPRHDKEARLATVMVGKEVAILCLAYA